MPGIICNSCYERLLISIEFRNLIRKSDKILREIIELNEKIVEADEKEDLNDLLEQEESAYVNEELVE
jgi:hypothetical protein